MTAMPSAQMTNSFDVDFSFFNPHHIHHSHFEHFFGLLLPQRHIRALDWARYLVTMFLVVSTVGVLLKMGARLAFDIKYVLTIPMFSMNI